MAGEGTFIGEVQRGWQRFWRLSWWWKGPILGGGGFVLVIIVVSVATGGTGNEPPKYPAGSLTVTEPADSATVDTEEIVIRGTAPPGAEVRRDIRGGKKDDKFNADANGQWEYRTKLDEGDNTFNFFLQDAKDVKAKLTVTYAPPVVAEPTATASPKPTAAPATATATAEPETTTPEPATATPAPITYEIAERGPVNIGPCIRIDYRVRVSGPLTEPQLRRIAQEIIDDETSQNDVNAIGFFFYLPGTDTSSFYTAGKADWAPNGVWAEACDVETGDYSAHELGAIDTNGSLE